MKHVLRSAFDRLMDGIDDGAFWARAIAWIVLVALAVTAIYIATGVVVIDPFDAF